MYKFVGGDLKFDLIIAIGIINFDDLPLWFVFIFGKRVAFLFVPTNAAHFWDIITLIINILLQSHLANSQYFYAQLEGILLIFAKCY